VQAPRYAFEILLATVAAVLVYRLARTQPGRVGGAVARFDGHAARHPALVILLVALLPLVIRLAVLPWVPPYLPRIHDEFGHLLVADTLAQGRLANPPHPLARHLETIYVLQSPGYASLYPIGQGLLLALGILLTGMPWSGVLLGVALMCGAITWMLQGHVPAGWAAVGGVLAVVLLGTPHGWIDIFYGGAFCALGGTVLFGALLRLGRGPSPMLGLAVGLGWGIVWLTRPYESLVPLVITWAILLALVTRARGRWRAWTGTLAMFVCAQLAVAGLTARHNQAVTGSLTTPPYVLAQRIYGVPHNLLGWPPSMPASFRTPEQAAVYETQRAIRAAAEARPLRHVGTVAHRAWRFFSGEWLTVPLLLGLVLLGDPVVRLSAVLLAGAFLTSAFYSSFFPHYWAAYSGVFLLLAIRGLMRLGAWHPAGRPVGWALAAFFVVGTLASTVRAMPVGPLLGVKDYGYVAPLRHQVAARLSAIPGQHAVFVRYGPTHGAGDEWVYNRADIDASRIVWLRGLGVEDDAGAIRYYEKRQFWLAEVEKSWVRVTRLRPAGGSPTPDGSSAEPEQWVLTRGSGAHR
jgi:hypothetical protein